MTTYTVWHGERGVLDQLRKACDDNCTCDPDHNHHCRAHELLTDQRTLDRLDFLWRRRNDLYRGEFTEPPREF